MKRTLAISMFAITACSEGFKTTEAEIDPIGDTTTDTGDAIDTGEADTDNPDECAEGPSSGSVSMDSNCTYIPEASGNPFQSRVEWSMAHSMTDADGNFFSSYVFSDEPEMKSVFQSPAIGQATDDDGNGSVDDRDTPDIAVVMGDELNGTRYSALRLISGDGSTVFDTVTALNHDGFTYVPTRNTGIAMGDVDNDGRMEIAATVFKLSPLLEVGTCHPALYQVSLNGTITLEAVGTDALFCKVDGFETYNPSHAPALADLDNDGSVEVIIGPRVYDSSSMALLAEGTDGEGWYQAWFVGSDGYWNSGYHSVPYDINPSTSDLEIVAGRTVYNSDGSVYCHLGSSSSKDGYAAVADVVSNGTGIPEIVITGNNDVSIYTGSPNSNGYCPLLDTITNKPENDSSISNLLPAHPDCDESRKAFGGPPTIADFNGDGTKEIGVSGACWYTVYDVNTAGTLSRYALTQTRDWSSASTGSTVFDFNGDGAAEIVFADEDALYVWGVDTAAWLDPWERLFIYLTDSNHRSWTIHEYPVVADVDGDGKSEIVVVNSGRPSYEDYYGLYVLGASDDDWVSARQWWNQNAYYITNIDEDGTIHTADPNYSPYTAADYNNFRTQAPGSFGALSAPDAVTEIELCQGECGPLTAFVQVANYGAFITISSGTPLGIYGISGASSTLIDTIVLPFDVEPGELSDSIAVDIVNWSSFDSIEAYIDDPINSPNSWGSAKECDETNNAAVASTNGFCP
ncbi:MAG: FG-GAP repeat domain-containing protein [Myxococcota bacterium]